MDLRDTVVIDCTSSLVDLDDLVFSESLAELTLSGEAIGSAPVESLSDQIDSRNLDWAVSMASLLETPVKLSSPLSGFLLNM